MGRLLPAAIVFLPTQASASGSSFRELEGGTETAQYGIFGMSPTG